MHSNCKMVTARWSFIQKDFLFQDQSQDQSLVVKFNSHIRVDSHFKKSFFFAPYFILLLFSLPTDSILFIRQNTQTNHSSGRMYICECITFWCVHICQSSRWIVLIFYSLEFILLQIENVACQCWHCWIEKMKYVMYNIRNTKSPCKFNDSIL